ncbi:protein-tyrosine phosphatase family protein [Roseibium sp. SCP14]|uniref:protein-tyrosine phosphatase family protein n=1 Tax=Roseibium sp. SCP14 TaxID=3141375 RepID=UPI0033384440
MTPSLYIVPTRTDGNLFIMPKPSGEWLRNDLQKLKQLDVDHIVSMLEPDEAASLGLTEEARLCREFDIRFTSVPVRDRGLPGVETASIIVQTIHQNLNAAKNVAVHCRAGIGRSGLIVCCALIADGETPGAAIEKVSQARGVAVPDTIEQKEFIHAFRIC